MSLDHTPIKLHAVYTGTNGKRKKEVKNDRKIKIEKAQLSAFVMANPARRHQTYKVLMTKIGTGRTDRSDRCLRAV